MASNSGLGYCGLSVKLETLLIDNKSHEFGLDNVGIYYVNSESKAQI